MEPFQQILPGCFYVPGRVLDGRVWAGCGGPCPRPPDEGDRGHPSKQGGQEWLWAGCYFRWGSKEAPCGGDIPGIQTCRMGSSGRGSPGRGNCKCEGLREGRDLGGVREQKVSGVCAGCECKEGDRVGRPLQGGGLGSSHF